MKKMDVDEWISMMPDDFVRLFGSVGFMTSLRELRNSEFQMPGKYDGAMSEECKALCRSNYELVTKLIARIGCE